MITTNLLSKLTNSNKLETLIGLNQALECIGVNENIHNLSPEKARELEKSLVRKYANLLDLENVAKSIKELISVEELENFRQEIASKINDSHATNIPINRKRIDTLKNSFEEVSGDNVL